MWKEIRRVRKEKCTYGLIWQRTVQQPSTLR